MKTSRQKIWLVIGWLWVWHLGAQTDTIQTPKPFSFYAGLEHRLPPMGQSWYKFIINGNEYGSDPAFFDGTSLSLGMEWHFSRRWSVIFQQNFSWESEFPPEKVVYSFYRDAHYISKDYLFMLRYRYGRRRNKYFSTDLGYASLNNGMYFYYINRDNRVFKKDFRAHSWVFQQNFHVDNLSLGIVFYFTRNMGDANWVTNGFFGLLGAQVKYTFFKY